MQCPLHQTPLFIVQLRQLRGPDSFRLHHERFAIGIKWISHRNVLLKTKPSPSNGKGQYTFERPPGKYATMKRSLLTIGTMLGLAIALAGYAVWFHYQQGHRCLALWGAETANLIRHAPRVELIVYPDDLPQREPQSIDISAKSGLVHARHALITDSSFDWTATSPGSTVDFHPDFALVFREAETQVVLVFDNKSTLVARLESIPPIDLEPMTGQRSSIEQAAADSRSRAVLSATALQALRTFRDRCRSR